MIAQSVQIGGNLHVVDAIMNTSNLDITRERSSYGQSDYLP